MSAFEIAVTPPRLKNDGRLEARQPVDVVMAPFSAKAIVQFEDVPVKKTAKRLLKIINPSDEGIEVKVTKSIKNVYNITIDWTENSVPANSEVQMEMTWSPVEVVACTESIQLTDSRNFRKDVVVVFKSNSNKSKTSRKFPTLSSGVGATHMKTIRLKSPKGGANRSGKLTQQTQQRIRLFTQMEKPVKKKENKSSAYIAQGQQKSEDKITQRNVFKQQQPQQHPLCPKEKQEYRSPLLEKNLISPECFNNTSFFKLEVQKENVSPLTPDNVLNMIDNLRFTPVTTEKSIKTTPVNAEREIRPRRLATAEWTEEYAALPEIRVDEVSLEESKGGPSEIVTNKTFDVKRNESVESIDDSSLIDGRLSWGGGGAVVLNKTTTIVATPRTRALEMIEEEDSHATLNNDGTKLSLTKTFDKLSSAKLFHDEDATEVLKRDIKLVGTPLKKYSESMKDLSLKSPTKISIQGSMPNLNDAQPLQSIEKNRYFHQSPLPRPQQAPTEKIQKKSHTKLTLSSSCNNSPNDSIHDNTYTSNIASLVSHSETMFNQNEILAQSSRFNIDEIGASSRKSSPLESRHKNSSVKPALMRQTPSKESPLSWTLDAGTQKRIRELFSKSPSCEFLAPNYENMKFLYRSASMHISPPKRMRIEADSSFQRLAPANASAAARPKSWSRTQPKKYKLAQTLSLTKKPTTPRKPKAEESRIKLYDSDLYLQSCINPDPFAATTTCDPFLASTMYLDEHAVERHQNDLKKWLNALVSIPADLHADCNAKIDVGKLFNEVRNKDLMLAPSKEASSITYLTKFRLESLRRAAVELFLSEEMRVPCSKVAVYINKNAIRIRSDRNLHLDVVMQRYILELLLYFNPLWLRLGLEVVYGEKINLSSNNDIVGLSTFILNRLFRDKYLEQKYSRAYTLSDDYAEHIKRFTLQKILFLLLFLDKAKLHRIVKHNPCLFVKKSPYKETKEILLKFSSELLANIGDITRELRRLGYTLHHKQTFLDEFDYAFNNLAVDLRDGIRLTRVMEVILLREDLTKQLRVPAISRLQRVFNVNLALRALQEADFELKGGIAATDIVDGHREKTLSLLWQIIYKFRSPKFHAAARVLQAWWRKSWLHVVIQRRIRRKEEERRAAAATIIQAAFRGYVTRRYVNMFRSERSNAAVTLQKYIRSHLARKRFYLAINAVLHIQRWCRAVIEGRRCRQQYLTMRDNCIYLQRYVRRWFFAKKLIQAAKVIGEIQAQARLRHEKAVIIQRFMRSIALHRKLHNAVHQVLLRHRHSKLEYRSAARLQSFFKSVRLRREFETKRTGARTIQQHWRSYKNMCSVRQVYLQQRNLIITVQRRFRAKLAMQQQRHEYQQLRSATVTLQIRFRARQMMIAARGEYLLLKQSVIKLQQRYRATLLMRKERASYLHQRSVIISVQQKIRAAQAMKFQRASFVRLRAAACSIQRYYRARLAMKQQRAAYTHLRQCVVHIQLKWRATRLARRVRVAYISLQYYATVVQQTYRATKLMRVQQGEYQQLRAATIFVQRCYRSKMQMRRDRDSFLNLRCAALTIQRRYRAYKLMRFVRAKYRGTCAAVICIQQYMRGYWLMKKERSTFKKKQQAALTLQRAYRAHREASKMHADFNRLKAAAICLQRRYRAQQCVRKTRQEYQRQRKLIIAVQRRFRAKLLARQVRQEYERKRALIIKLQQRFRATMSMRRARQAYSVERTKLISLQSYIRAFIAMKRQVKEYQRQRQAAVRLQAWYRAVLQKRRDQQAYQSLRSSAILIQTRWRATKVMRVQRTQYLCDIQKIVLLQRRMRATLQMRQQSLLYQRQKWAAVVLQRRYRARREMLKVRNQYLLIRSLVVCLQRKYRAHRAMMVVRSDFLLLRRTAVHLQQRFRGRLETHIAREQFLQLKSSTLCFQAHIRGFLARKRFQSLMTPEMIALIQQRKAARIIQRHWRGYRVRQRWRNVRILKIRENIKLLKDTSTAINSIRWKVRDAVHLLRGRVSASDALNVLSRLERLSRTVPHLLMDHSDFISSFCYGIMAQTIRSEVDKQLIEHCSRIILNLARYNSTTANTFQQAGLTTIAQMLMRWCNKDCDIFNTLCTLIWIFAHCPQKRKIIHEFMTTPEAIFVIRETRKLLARKEKMKQNVRKPLVPGTQQQQQAAFSSYALPSLEPDYGVVRNKPYTFISSVYAFEVVLCKLGIDIHGFKSNR